MRWICLSALYCVLLTSCGSDPVARPFAVETEKKPQVGPKPKTKAKVKKEAKSKVEPKADPGKKSKRKALAGKVTFHNLTRRELDAFRVIPETGRELIVPNNQTYDQVDGFWWREAGAREWFKIPDSSEAWIGKAKAPIKFDGTAHRDGLQVFYRSNPLVHFVGMMRNGVKHPAWVRDAGSTKSPVPSPWVESL